MPSPGPGRAARAAEAVALLILLLAGAASFAGDVLPAVVPASAAPRMFSGARAMRDLATIAATPHATGSVAHDRLRDYLVDRLRAVGCDDVHIQSATGFNTLDGPIAATVANVVGRKRGLHGGPAILLMAHYDAVPRSFGAGDNGAAVAAILETLRALDALPPLDRDVMVVFTDAEEDGLLGAEAFVDLHPWASNVGAVLNFDGRGDQGPVFMFQTSPGDAPLIAALAASVPDVRANSLTGEVYRHIPGDTDLSIWLHAGLAVGALNFAHIAGYTHYHTPIDNIASLDPRIVQHIGNYALGLAVELGHESLAELRTHDLVYFTVPGFGVVRYPVSWATPLMVLVLLVVAWTIIGAVRRHSVTRAGAGRGVLLLLAMLALPGIVTLAGWRLVLAAHPAYADILQRDPYNSLAYLLAAMALALALALAMLRRFSRAGGAVELAIPALLLWAALGGIVTLLLPGASYLFAWPLLAAACGIAYANRATHPPAIRAALIALTAVPALVLWPALIRSLEVGLTASLLPLCALLVGLLAALLIVPLLQLGRLQVGVIGATALLAAGALTYAESTAGFNATRKHPDSLAYLIDTDAHTARWVSFDRVDDRWTGARLGRHPAGRWSPPFPFAEGQSVLAGDPVPTRQRDSSVRLVRVLPAGDGRRVHLHVARTGAGEMLTLQLEQGAAISDVVINARPLRDGGADRYRPEYRAGPGNRILQYFGVPPEGVDLWFTMAGHAPAMLRVESGIEGFPEPVSPRPDDLMSKPFVPTDMTIVEQAVVVPDSTFR